MLNKMSQLVRHGKLQDSMNVVRHDYESGTVTCLFSQLVVQYSDNNFF